jgi:hypothetical protein
LSHWGHLRQIMVHREARLPYSTPILRKDSNGRSIRQPRNRQPDVAHHQHRRLSPFSPSHLLIARRHHSLHIFMYRSMYVVAEIDRTRANASSICAEWYACPDNDTLSDLEDGCTLVELGTGDHGTTAPKDLRKLCKNLDLAGAFMYRHAHASVVCLFTAASNSVDRLSDLENPQGMAMRVLRHSTLASAGVLGRF